MIVDVLGVSVPKKTRSESMKRELRKWAKLEMNSRYKKFMEVTGEWGMSKSFLGRVLDMMPMDDDEEEELVVNICEGLRAAYLDYQTQDPSWLPGYKHRMYKLELSMLRQTINKRFESSWFRGDLSSDGREAWYLHECETGWEGWNDDYIREESHTTG
tara:strand:+ start:287 stop:760 length:474 start_codon:yes stop_codon:yes gene_type:complete